MPGRRNSSSQKQLEVGALTIAYTLTRANRKSVGITIRPDMSVSVRVPRTISDDAVEEILQQRAAWITRHLEKFAQRPVKVAISSKPAADSYLFLGQHLPFTVAPLSAAPSGQEDVQLQHGTIFLWVKGRGEPARVARLLEKWSRTQAERYFMRRMATLFALFKDYSLTLPALKLRKMRARWGSCSTTGTITLNVKLIHLEPALIDYVIMHELCHLIEHNHSKHFYALLTRMMPDWQARRHRLNELGMPE